MADDDLPQLAALARTIHRDGESPFRTDWAERPSPSYEREFARYFRAQRAEWDADEWRLPFAVRWNETLVGVQQLCGREFVETRVVATSSWLAARAQGAGLGTVVREAVLTLAFDWLGAERAVSGAFRSNVASIRVSEKLGYHQTGIDILSTPRGLAEELRFALDRHGWRARARGSYAVDGLGPCLELFGVTAQSAVMELT